MKKIKVLHVLHSVGGVDVSLRLILENLNAEKFENIVIHGTNDTDMPFKDSKGNVVKSYRVSILRNISAIKDFKAIYSSYKIIKKEKPDILHSHSAKGGIIGRLLGRLLNITVLHTPQAYSYLSTENKFKRKIYILIEKFFANHNSILLASSNSEKNRAIEEVGYKPSNTIVFNNSINKINNIAKLSIKKEWPDNYICTVGRPSYQKNIELLIRVIYEIKKNHEIYLVLMGVGYYSPELNNIRKLITSLSLESNISLLEWTSRDDVFNIINKSKLYISTARYEGLPYSIIESLALSKAIIVSDCDGNRDLVIDNYNGFVIKDGNPKSFAEKVIRILNDEELQDKFSKNSKQYFSKNLDIQKNIHHLANIYRENLKFKG